MAKKVILPLTLSIVKNNKGDFSIMREGGCLQFFDEGLMDSQMILQYATNLAKHIHRIEKRTVRVLDNFSKSTACCPNCKSINVETKAWLNLLDGNVETISNDAEDQYCPHCDSHEKLDSIKIDPSVGLVIYQSRA